MFVIRLTFKHSNIVMEFHYDRIFTAREIQKRFAKETLAMHPLIFELEDDYGCFYSGIREEIVSIIVTDVAKQAKASIRAIQCSTESANSAAAAPAALPPAGLSKEKLN